MFNLEKFTSAKNFHGDAFRRYEARVAGRNCALIKFEESKEFALVMDSTQVFESSDVNKVQFVAKILDLLNKRDTFKTQYSDFDFRVFREEIERAAETYDECKALLQTDKPDLH